MRDATIEEVQEAITSSGERRFSLRSCGLWSYDWVYYF